MYQQSLITFTFTVALAATLFASPGTEFRDRKRQRDPRWETIEKLLEITPLASEADRAILRIWDGSSNLSISVRGSAVSVDVVRGHGDAWFSIIAEHNGMSTKRIPDADRLLEVRKSCFEFQDKALAQNLNYLLSRIAAFDSGAKGLDGDYTFFDAVDATGKLSTFEIWSPREDEQPFAFDLCNLHWTFVELVRLSEAPDETWRSHDKLNFMTRFPNVAGVNLTREKAKGIVREAFRTRLQSLITELKRH